MRMKQSSYSNFKYFQSCLVGFLVTHCLGDPRPRYRCNADSSSPSRSPLVSYRRLSFSKGASRTEAEG